MTGAVRPKIQISGEAGRMDNYAAAVRALGGDPAPACCPAPDMSCDGLVLCGGGDIEPALYGQEDRGSLPPDRLRDRAELALFEAYFQAGKPILGICRGAQLINVALGGTLLQDLPGEVKPFHGGGPRDLVHAVRAEEGSVLHRLYGPVFSVNSSHHQAIDRLGGGLRAVARSESDVVEAVELPGCPLLGLQFHPERMAFAHRRPDTVDAAPLLAHFMDRCR